MRCLIAVLVLVSASPAFAEGTNQVVFVTGTNSVLNAKITTSGETVRPNSKGYTGHGFIVGSPVNSGETGWWFKTYEVHVNQGRFPDDQTYIGDTVSLSIDGKNKELFDKFRAIENRNHDLFVFEYVYKSLWNPEIEDTHTFLTQIYTPAEFLDHIKASK
jgi:hypothetical protein